MGPIITLEWMRRTKKFCWHSRRTGRHERSENPLDSEAENQVETDTEREIRTMEEGENRTGEPVQYRERPAEEQPLLSAVSNESHDVRSRPRGNGCVKKYHRDNVCDIAKGFCYLILILAALPVGRFDYPFLDLMPLQATFTFLRLLPFSPGFLTTGLELTF